jgi:sigma-E factor negative regulatory protein RseC
MSGGEKKRRIWIDNVLGAQQGDCVVFSIDEKDVVVSSLVLYLVPVVFLIAGAAMGASLHGRLSMDRDSLAALGGAAGFLLSLIVVALVSRLAVRRGVFSPRMLDVSGRR